MLSHVEDMDEVMPEIVKYVESNCYIFTFPYMFSNGYGKSDMYSDLKANPELKRVFVEACMKADVTASVLYDYAKSMFGDNDLLFYLYILGTNFRRTSLYRTYFKSNQRPETGIMFVLKFTLIVLLIIVLIIVIILVNRRMGIIRRIKNKID